MLIVQFFESKPAMVLLPVPSTPTIEIILYSFSIRVSEIFVISLADIMIYTANGKLRGRE